MKFSVINKVLTASLFSILLSSCEGGKKLTDDDIDVLINYLSVVKQVAEDTLLPSQDVDINKSVKVFDICNSKIYSQYPKYEKITRLYIQENLYGFTGNMGNKAFYRTAVIANENPALNIGVSNIFKALVTPTDTQKAVYTKEFDKFQKGAYQETEKHRSELKSIFKNSENITNKKFLVTKLSPELCFTADLYLSLFDYRQVGEYETISRKAGAQMLINNSSKSMKIVREELESLGITLH